ncbi:MAG: S49 family peptidase [Pseudomonadota bacterium]
MRYARILAAVAGTPWAIEPAKGQAIMDFLSFAAAGGKRSPEEVAAVIAREAGEPRRGQDDQRHATEGKAIAVVGLKGVISPRISDEMDVSGPGGTSAEGFARRFKAAADDPRIGGVIIDVDSPGGAVFGTPEAADAVLAARGVKPIVAVANPSCASAALWIASAADDVVVMRSGEIGSLGVYTYHEDVSERLAARGVKPTLVKASISPVKADWHPAFPLSEDAAANLQVDVDRYGTMFVDAVAHARGKSTQDVIETFGGGRMLSAERAVAVGMADRIGTLDDEIARMAAAIASGDAGNRPAASMARRRREVALW